MNVRLPVLRAALSSALGWAALSAVLCGATAAPAVAPLDLGRGLTYVRVHRWPDDLARVAAAWSAPALVVDLRYPMNGGGHAAGPDLSRRPNADPLLVLIGPGTHQDALARLREFAPGLITVGLPAPGIVPDLALTVKPEIDRQAYEALDAGASLDSLVAEKNGQPRFNEAALAREHENGGPDDSDRETDSAVKSDVAPAAVPSGPPGAAAPAAAGAPPPPLKDLVLERAVQLHRTLLALGLLAER